MDTEQWIEEVEVRGERKPQVMFSHYVKPMASKLVIHRESAHPIKTRLNILIADLVRVMRNVSQKCPYEERRGKIQTFIHRLQFSGYSKSERHRVYTKAKQRYDEMIRQDEQGIQPLYRSRNWNREERIKEKERKRKNWFRQNNDSEAVMFVDATPNEELAKRCRDTFKAHGLKVKVVERTARTIKRSLVRSNPFKQKGCQRLSCNVCKLGTQLNCKSREVVYKISCGEKNNECKGVDYIGETSRSVSERFDEHLKVMNSECKETRKKSFLHDHVEKIHNGIPPPLNVEILASCTGDPSMRQALEAVLIRKNDPVLNRKQEWTNEPRQRKSRK